MVANIDIWRIFAGLGIFLFGMFYIELALKNLAGRSFKKFLRHYTNNPVSAVIVGTIITALLQSSSVVTLMVLAFVGAGTLNLKNAIGIIMGSNLGTTFTGWFVAFLGFKVEIDSYCLPMIAIGGLSLVVFQKSARLFELSRFILGFGFIFMGLDYMKTSIDDLNHFVDLGRFAYTNYYLFFPVGVVLTAMIQSSSASMVVTLSALNSGIISLKGAAAMIVGSDLGTTVTALLGAFRGSADKKRVALSHVIFNTASSVLALMLLPALIDLITNKINISDHLYALVFFHSSFNLLALLLILPFIGMFARFLSSRFKKHEVLNTTYIHSVPVNVPDAAIEALHKETKMLTEQVFYLNISALNISQGLFTFSDAINKEDPGIFKPNKYLENYASAKELAGEIMEYYLNIQNQKLKGNDSTKINQIVRAVGNATTSAKEIKDIAHNIREFENSANDHKRSLYILLKGSLNEFYLSLHDLFHSEQSSICFERLTDLLKDNQKIFEKSQTQIYQQIEKESLSELEIISFLNVIREIHHANRTLILATKDLLLPTEEAESFLLVLGVK